MGFVELLLLSVGLAMDAFAVSICKGLSMKRASIKGMASCGIWFGGFQALMPLVGFLLGSLFAEAIEAVDHWVAFALLFLIGINMLKEAFSKKGECDCTAADFSFKVMLTMALATSIDALAIGISLAMAGDVISALFQELHQFLRIHQILGATEGDNVDLVFNHD